MMDMEEFIKSLIAEEEEYENRVVKELLESKVIAADPEKGPIKVAFEKYPVKVTSGDEPTTITFENGSKITNIQSKDFTRGERGIVRSIHNSVITEFYHNLTQEEKEEIKWLGWLVEEMEKMEEVDDR